jgi:peptide deformylase
MVEFMYKNNGIGLAGNQIKIFERLVVVDLNENGKKHPIFMVNPSIDEKSEEMEDSYEGCLSINGISASVKRYKSISVKYLDKQGKENLLEANGLLSACIQHEIDLLDGITFLDRVEAKTNDIQEMISKIDNDGKSRLRMKTIVNDIDFLKKKSEPVTEINQGLIDLMKEMLQFMYDNKGIGLAGVQVGILKRIIVIDIKENEQSSPLLIINPEIVWHSDNLVEGEEGCLSVPEERENVKRYEKIRVRYINEKKKLVTIEAGGLLSICLQHEIDHLNGVIFIDHLSKIKRDFLIKRVLKNRKK